MDVADVPNDAGGMFREADAAVRDDVDGGVVAVGAACADPSAGAFGVVDAVGADGADVTDGAGGAVGVVVAVGAACVDNCGLQSSCDIDSGPAVVVPLGHDRHSSRDDAPETFRNVPTGQSSHDVAPILEL